MNLGRNLWELLEILAFVAGAYIGYSHSLLWGAIIIGLALAWHFERRLRAMEEEINFLREEKLEADF